MNLISIAQAAKRLGISRQRVHVLVRQGRIKAERIGKVWAIPEKALSGFAKTRRLS